MKAKKLTVFWAAILAVGTLVLTGCGQSGALYLPEKAPTTNADPSASSSEQSKQKDS